MRPTTLADKLESYRTLIFNSRDTQVAPLLNAMGVNNAYLKQGEDLYHQTMQLVEQQKKEYQEQSLAYDTFYLEKDKVEAMYERTLKLVKVMARKDKDLQNRLQLQNGKATAIAGWIDQAIGFYNHLLLEKDFLITLAKFKLTTAQLKVEQKATENLKLLRDKAKTEKGGAQEATRDRNEKLEELADYSVELKTIAQLALEEKPQLMEKLGVLVRS